MRPLSHWARIIIMLLVGMSVASTFNDEPWAALVFSGLAALVVVIDLYGRPR